MTRWEYFQHFQSTSDFPYDRLNDLGSRGWELVYVHHGATFYRYIFKRQLVQKPQS